MQSEQALAEEQHKRDSQLYRLLEAAYVGCVDCVKYWVEVKQLGHMAQSAHMGYTPHDWATWGLQSGNERGDLDLARQCTETLQFLDACAQTVRLPPLRKALFDTLYPKGAAMLRAHSGVEGRVPAAAASGGSSSSSGSGPLQPLGIGSTPVHAHTIHTRRPGDQRGLGF